MFPKLLFLTISSLVYAQINELSFLCESIICDPPKKCDIIDEVAQCVVDPAATTQNPANMGFQLPFFNTQAPIAATPAPTLAPTPTTPTTPENPLAGFFGLFGQTVPPLFSLPPAPTIPPPATTPPTQKTEASADFSKICRLPPVTGSCSRARIMWYYENSSQRCERFSYSGCGNENRFASKKQCERMCAGF